MALGAHACSILHTAPPTGSGPPQVSEGTTPAENAHGASRGAVQVCVQRYHQVHWEGKTDITIYSIPLYLHF